MGTDSVHSFVIDKVFRKVSERSFINASGKTNQNGERETFIKKELKRAVRRIFKAEDSQNPSQREVRSKR